MTNYSLLWLQSAACGGDSMSLLGVENPDLVEVLENNRIQLLWHPSLSPERPSHLAGMAHEIVTGERGLDILCIEGAIAHGPEGTGMADRLMGRPKREVIAELCAKARIFRPTRTCSRPTRSARSRWNCPTASAVPTTWPTRGWPRRPPPSA